MPARRFSPIFAIFFTVLLDMLSFGLVIPDLQIRAEGFGARGTMLGLVLAVFSLTQFVLSPIAGRLSDRFGRKPVLLVGAALNGIAFIVYAFAQTIPSIFVARILAGAGSANLAAAFAFVADSSEPEQRAKSIGKIGAAFGLGFVMGPPLGGFLAKTGGNMLLGFTAATLSLVNVIWILTALKEQRHAEGIVESRVFSLQKLTAAFAVPGLSVLLLLFFSYNFGFSNLESTFVLFAKKVHGLDQQGSGLILGYVGIITAITQGLLIAPLTSAFGERTLARIGLTLVAPALALMPFVPTVGWILVLTTFLSFGAGIAGPTVQSLISRASSRDIQGGIFGITQGLGALARILGPITGQTALARNYHYPFLIAGGVVLFPVILAWFFIPEAAAPETQASSP